MGTVGATLNPNETILQASINAATNNSYATAVVGKWHLAGNNGTFNPEDLGIDYYAGLIRGSVDDYYNWQITEDGVSRLQQGYSTEVFTTLALSWINHQSKPWFMWLAYNAPHTPFHVPPTGMHNQGPLPTFAPGADPLPYYLAAIEAMDFQIGRLMNGMDLQERRNTTVIFMGDNGTPEQVAQSPYSSNKVKNTLYQGGINVPLFVTGKNVGRTGTEDALLTSTDLYATLSELAGVNNFSSSYSSSFASLLSNPNASAPSYQYADFTSSSIARWVISNGTYKLHQGEDGVEELYLLPIDPYENNNLLQGTLSPEAAAAKFELETELARIRQ